MQMVKRWSLFIVLLSIMTVLAACGGNGDDNNADNQDNADQEDAAEQDNNADQEQNDGAADNENADMDNTENADTQTIEADLENGDQESVGTAKLEEKADGVNVTLKGENLPKGTHAFHIHAKGACEAPDFKSAKGHYNPDDTDHGFDTPNGPHAGDMPNIEVGENGTVTQSFLVRDVTLDKDDDHSLTADGGTALVIHEGADDGESQPSGDAGNRLACGVIRQ
ncbi:hypothetical protein GCM10028778_17150 [Barrientosiimonas marina]|uniref:Superoxide dismutase [Cu-Zn] n=1 Tax=Lentibacillus kimchii TaxID=1542911 RepID=A0ABW2UZC3_9BACI